MLSVPDVALEKYAVDASSFKVVSKIMLNKTAISMFLKKIFVFSCFILNFILNFGSVLFSDIKLGSNIQGREKFMLDFLLIFGAKVVEVSLATLRMVSISKGRKTIASSIGFVEVLIWLKVVSMVLIGINDQPLRVLAYALGFAVGSFVGLVIEEKIGLGYSNIQIITDSAKGEKLASLIRDKGKAVTVIKSNGIDKEKVILSTYVKRRNKQIILDCVKEVDVKGLVTVSETQKVYGGFGLK